jgi:hypothetical protein
VLLILLDLSQSFGGICVAHPAGFIPVFWWDLCCSSCWIYPSLLVGSVLLILLDLSQSFGGICVAHLAGFIPFFWWDLCRSSCWSYLSLLVGSVLLILLDLSQSFGGICVALSGINPARRATQILPKDWDNSSKMSNTDPTKRLR